MQGRNQERKKDGSLCDWYRLDMGKKLCVNSKNHFGPCNVELCPVKELKNK